ncbi:GAP family protein [Gordonia sp. NPDC003504]
MRVVSAIGSVLPIAIALAIAPLTIISGIVLLLGERGRLKAALFGGGWFVVIAAVTAVAYLVTDVAEEEDVEVADDGVHVLTAVIGVFFLVLAVVMWFRRPRSDEPHEESALIRRVTGMSPIGALGLGAAEGVVVIKNIPLCLGAGAVLARSSELAAPQAWAVIAAFALVASAGVFIPVLIAVAGGRRLDAPLAATRTWLEHHMSPITIVTLLVVGVYFLLKAFTVI